MITKPVELLPIIILYYIFLISSPYFIIITALLYVCIFVSFLSF